jgi:hypothetical protein
MSSYVTLEEAAAYVAGNLINSLPWDSANEATRTKALNISTKKIDALNFLGDKTDSSQELQFPRGGDTEVPEAIKEATILLAVRLLDDVDPEREFENQFMSSFQYENIKSTYDRSRVAINVLHGIPSWEAWIRIQPYLYETAAVRLTRVS